MWVATLQSFLLHGLPQKPEPSELQAVWAGIPTTLSQSWDYEQLERLQFRKFSCPLLSKKKWDKVYVAREECLTGKLWAVTQFGKRVNTLLEGCQ